ncbi:MAG: glycosyl transferase [Clostridia bacterium]|nr:glycosyl transferase [Clostridia bacterium]
MSENIDNLNSNKHAYLIMCHNNFSVLETSLRLLDDTRNDIYIHIDKKVKKYDKDKLLSICRYSRIYFTKKRYKVKWGTYSQVFVEMYLFKYAFFIKQEKYRYYHLISGTDLPLKNQEDMHSFFDNRYDIFLNCDDDVFAKKHYGRISNYHFNNKILNKIIWQFQKVLHIDRIKKYNMKFYLGANWCSLPNYAVEYLLKKEKFIKKICHFSVCSDECYKQFIIFNSPLANRIFCNKDGHPDNLREVDWTRTNDAGHPHIYDTTDIKLLVNSEKFFARKFDENVCPQIISFIYDYIINNSAKNN